MQLTTGRMGKLEIIGKVEADSSKESDSKIRTNIPMRESDEEELNVEEEDIEDTDDEI